MQVIQAQGGRDADAGEAMQAKGGRVLGRRWRLRGAATLGRRWMCRGAGPSGMQVMQAQGDRDAGAGSVMEMDRTLWVGDAGGGGLAIQSQGGHVLDEEDSDDGQRQGGSPLGRLCRKGGRRYSRTGVAS